MSEAVHRYYEDQKTVRQMECDNGVDPVWYHAMMRKQRLRERLEEYRLERDQQFAFKDINTISDMLSEHGIVVSASDTSVDSTPTRKDDPNVYRVTGKRRRKFFLG